MTAHGTTMGTLGFMPPEQARGHADKIDARCDVWAVAATLVTLLTGRRVHADAAPTELLFHAMTTPARPASTLAPGIPPSLAAVLDRALSFEPALRHADAGEMRRALRAASDRVIAKPKPKPKRFPWVVAPAVLVLGAAAFFAARPPASPAPPRALPSEMPSAIEQPMPTSTSPSTDSMKWLAPIATRSR